MIVDTNEIRNRWAMYVPNTVCPLELEKKEIKELCDSHDELERKLKIAEDCFDKAIRSLKNGSHTKNIAVIIINEALKQIRGE